MCTHQFSCEWMQKSPAKGGYYHVSMPHSLLATPRYHPQNFCKRLRCREPWRTRCIIDPVTSGWTPSSLITSERGVPLPTCLVMISEGWPAERKTIWCMKTMYSDCFTMERGKKYLHRCKSRVKCVVRYIHVQHGHFGSRRTVNLMYPNFFWANMGRYVGMFKSLSVAVIGSIPHLILLPSNWTLCRHLDYSIGWRPAWSLEPHKFCWPQVCHGDHRALDEVCGRHTHSRFNNTPSSSINLLLPLPKYFWRKFCAVLVAVRK